VGGPETASNTWFSSPHESATALKAASDWFSRFAPLTRVPVAHRPRRYSQHRQQRLHRGPHDGTKLEGEDASHGAVARINRSINVKFVGPRYTTRPGAPTVVSGKHDHRVHS